MRNTIIGSVLRQSSAHFEKVANAAEFPDRVVVDAYLKRRIEARHREDGGYPDEVYDSREKGGGGALMVRRCQRNPDDHERCEIRFSGMLLIVAIILMLLWGAGLAFRVAGGLIHLLLVIALIVFILHLVGFGKG